MTKEQLNKLSPAELAQLMRKHVMDRGGPVTDESGNYITSVWPWMLRAAELLEAIKGEQNA